MNVLHNPARSTRHLHFPKRRADGEPARHASDGSMKESGVACPQFAHQIVHRELEIFWGFGRQNAITSALSQRGPVRAVVTGIEIMLLNLSDCSLEYPSALLVCQCSRLELRFFACHLRLPSNPPRNRRARHFQSL